MAGDLNGGRGAGAKRPMRPRELQDPLNHYLYHPLAWQLARKLAPTPLTPNMVSIFGGLCVVAAEISALSFLLFSNYNRRIPFMADPCSGISAIQRKC